MLGIIVLSLVSSFFFYIEAVKWGMNAKCWGAAALVFGPMLYPMFSIARHVQWRRSVGFNNLFMTA
jgi:hypothetical protein